MSGWNLLGIIGLCVASASANAGDRSEEIRSFLERFGKNPAAAMESLPEKWDARGAMLPPGSPWFTSDDIRSRDFVLLKGASTPAQLVQPFAGIGGWDGPEPLVRDIKYGRLEDMDQAHLTTVRLGENPWSGDYWPLYAGMIARRYADPKFPNSANWKENNDYILSSANSSSVASLSPAEKYDLLVGDEGRGLTASALEAGGVYFRETGKVESWMGICHGWAAASFTTPRPSHAVTVVAADGRTRIPFYPSDLKALTSLLWANAYFPTDTVGRRCDKKDPKRNDNGRVLDGECFDENPGAWHLAVVNRLGVNKQSFVIDATFDYQVWNQPVSGYHYTYFNPKTGQPAPTLEGARVMTRDFPEDKFKEFRSDKADSVVGVAMDLTYIGETPPSVSNEDSPEDDYEVSVRYIYDLELDTKGRIVGGEWYQNAHPDFLWSPSPEARPRSVGDNKLDVWDPSSKWGGDGAMPGIWSKAARLSSRYGLPLAKVVDVLTALAQLGV